MAEQPALIPWPRQIELRPGRLQLSAETPLVLPAEAAWHPLGDYLLDKIKDLSGLRLELAGSQPETKAFVLSNELGLGEEAYRLSISGKGLHLAASQPAGAFYGIQTLLQLLGPDGSLPFVEIEDAPRFAWRGLMLDVARHFFPLPVIQQLIDWLAAYKFNRLHLHLTDDQGWRIEIQSWPRLAEIGGRTSVDGDGGGFYSQADYRRIVDYAVRRHITIVPEIDLPGHSNAALASYAQLNCDGRAPELYEGIEVGFSSLCIEKDITYQFIEDVLGEVADLTPGAWLHLGGDEAHATSDEDYRCFMARLLPLARATGKQVIGWQELAKGGPPAGTLLQYWDERLELELPAGTQLIASPASKAYLDMKYNAESPLGLEWAGHVPLEQTYAWDPAALLEGVGDEQIAGVEAALWTETLRSQADLEYMLFPRLPGLAEVAWSPRAVRRWADYRPRLAAHAQRWAEEGLRSYRSVELDL